MGPYLTEATMQEARRILTARDIMATRLITFRPEQPIHDAINLLLKHRRIFEPASFSQV